MSRRIDKQRPVQSCAICFPSFSKRCSTFSCRYHVEISVYNEVSGPSSLLANSPYCHILHAHSGMLDLGMRWGCDGNSIAAAPLQSES